MKKLLIVVGSVPPPVTGKTVVTRSFIERYKELTSGDIELLNLSAGDIVRTNRYYSRRLQLMLSATLSLLREIRNSTRVNIYLSVSGGYAQLFELVVAAIGRGFGLRMFLHHHSCAYINNKSRLTRTLVQVAGRDAMHILQSPNLSSKFARTYEANLVVGVSNVGLVMTPHTYYRRESKRNRIGFFSNILPEKGIYIFIEMLERAELAGIDIIGVVAGRFFSHDTKTIVMEKLESLKNAIYVGPKDGNQKKEYFEGIDIFVFPTIYRNETEGLVNYEAMQHGVPVIAYDRGCIKEMLGPTVGLIVNRGDDFPSRALTQIAQWQNDEASYAKASKESTRRFMELVENSNEQWRRIITSISCGS